MKRTSRISFFLMSFFLSLTLAWAQDGTTISGKLVEPSGETVIGANIYIKGTTIGTVTSLDGTFKFTTSLQGKHVLIISSVGMATIEKEVSLSGIAIDLGSVEMLNDAVGLAEVMVFADVAIDRRTPVAVSNLKPETIEAKLGTQEFPEILKSTPSVYATKQGGGYGDGRINVRGFDSPNVAVMINGIPVNDMEWGGVYWSNWAGLSDVTRSMQIQRGLGASKVAVPSVGGSINVLTKTTDSKRGGSFSSAIGNDGYNKFSFNVSTGLTEKDWAITLLGSRTAGDGYIQGTEFEGYSYFFNISKRINEKHQLSLTGFGAKQWHNQRSSFDKLKIDEWPTKQQGYKYNGTFGYGSSGQRIAGARNYYHKPQYSLNHYWTINERSHLSTALYGSYGNGGGHSARGNNRSWLYGTDNTYRTLEGYKDYAAIQLVNSQDPNGSQAIIGSSNNNHLWFGAISTYNNQIKENLDFYGGIDIRYYIGEHNRTIVDLLGGEFFIDPDRENVEYKADDPTYVNQKLSYNDIISRDYLGYVLWTGGFAQAEYSYGNLSAFLSGALSNTTYWRYDRMYYPEGQKESDKINFPGFSIKGGANYNLTDFHNLFANIGYFSRAPYFSSVFLAKDNSNAINNAAVNEKIFSTELGYGFRSSFLNGNINVYRTEWRDKTFTTAVDNRNPDLGRVNAQGVTALHQGIEFDLVSKPIRNLELTAMLSIGDWKWVDDVEAFAQDRDGRLVDEDGNVVTDPEEAYKVNLLIGNVHIGDAAQTTAALGATYFFLKDFRIGLDYNYFARLFADYGGIDDLKGTDTWQVPEFHLFDLNAGYNFEIMDFQASINGNINNLFDAEYISDAESASGASWQDADVFYGFGRTWSVSFKLRF